jgi:large-conductance mechanosensitive channel
MADQKKRAPRKKLGLPDVVTADAATVAKLGKSQVSDFVNFIRQQGVIGLAVGLAVGTAAGAAVKQIVDGFINPIVGFIIGGIDLKNLNWTVVAADKAGKGGLVIGWGAILSALITLVATALVVYLIVHYAKLDRLDKTKS